MKSVLWTEAMHVPVLLTGSTVLLIVGLTSDRRPGRAARRQSRDDPPVAPVVDHTRDAGHPRLSVRPEQHSVARRAAHFTDHRPVVLVYGSIHRAARADCEGSAGSSARHDVRCLSETGPGLHLPAARHDCRRAVQAGRSGIRVDRRQSTGRVPGAGLEPASGRAARAGARGHAVGADERARFAVQFDGNALHRRLLQAPAAAIERDDTSCSSAASPLQS